jgi:hypothetical protein
MRVQHLGKGLHKILQEVKAIGDLECGGSPLPGPVSIGSGPSLGDRADGGMRLQPQGHGLSLAIR